MFTSITAAVIAALHLASITTKSTAHEYVGVIFETPTHQYIYTQPQEGDEDHFRLVVEIPSGDKLVAIYHTHPAADLQDSDGDRFSPADVVVADQLNVPSFIWVQRNNTVREFIPGRSYVQKEDSDAGCSEGEMVKAGI
ncbi:MAG: DUF4329 domain-containing protein [Steroidobacteraceae bacterium]